MKLTVNGVNVSFMDVKSVVSCKQTDDMVRYIVADSRYHFVTINI